MKKRIMIDGYNLDLKKGTGVATYARNLSYCLHELGYEVEILYGNDAKPEQSNLLKEIAFFDKRIHDIPAWLRILKIAKESLYAPLGYRATKIPITGTVINDKFKNRLPYFDAIYNAYDVYRRANNAFGIFKRVCSVHLPRKPDLMHWTYPIPLKISGILNVYTLHDLVPLRLPYTTLDNKGKYLSLVKKLTQSADHIITVSEASKRDIVNILGIHPDKITNTYQSISIPKELARRPLEKVQADVERIFGLTYKDYFLFFGAIEPKKNVGGLLEAYLGSGVVSPLVIVGASAWKAEQELGLLCNDNMYIMKSRTAQIKDKIIKLDYVSFPLLISLIKGSKAVLFPSLYEGFGLPVLEAMHLEVPVISSTTGSIPEVAGDAAILVNPYDLNGLADAIRSVDNDDVLRKSLAEKGKARAALFSEEAYQKRLNEVYRMLLQ